MARFLHRVRLENYKSIAHCDVELKDLTFLVGPNGAGKSNFLSALFMFLYNEMHFKLSPLDDIFKWGNYMRRDADLLEVEFSGTFGTFKILKQSNQNAIVESDHQTSGYNIGAMHNLKLVTHNFKNPCQSSDGSIQFLASDGSNLANIILKLEENSKTEFQKVNKYIQLICPEIQRIWVLQAGGYDIIQFTCVGIITPFNSSQMSDGTLYALGVLTAIFYAKSANIPLVGIEEPEAGLHPAAARVLREALMEASEDVQIIVTSHSPDLLDSPDIDPDSILAVVRENGETKIGPIDAASRKSLSEHLFTAGELLRMNQLEPAA